MNNFNFETTPILALLTWFAIGIVLMLLIGYFYVKFCNRWKCWCRKKDWQEREYEERYNEIDRHLRETDANNPMAKGIIGAELKKLKALEYKNTEKTRFVTMEYLKKFYGCTEKLSVHDQVKLINETRL